VDIAQASPSADEVEQLQRSMLALEAQGLGVTLDTWHSFADGMVARTILIPAGTCLTGAKHKAAHLNIACGDITVSTAQGMQRITGYHVLPGVPGVQRVGMAHADTIWTTVHLNPTNTTDLAEIEDALVEDAQLLQRNRLALAVETKEALQ
jgi:hypothetical protein